MQHARAFMRHAANPVNEDLPITNINIIFDLLLLVRFCICMKMIMEVSPYKTASLKLNDFKYVHFWCVLIVLVQGHEG